MENELNKYLINDLTNIVNEYSRDCYDKYDDINWCQKCDNCKYWDRQTDINVNV